ncbi:hypothetical protein GCM10007862_25230 [Dyella lipolytica]|uniref:Uncharacterized protein n=1 Tax=Dyella lipolytica TaxID=1867835 RepID=A0ABW8IUI1_9GAMM|nr:hypothetical protein [Dyella lipolytica]GLQ47472.1 hypothetical protein GCM10007862_25230 [Dyella lipolytica]
MKLLRDFFRLRTAGRFSVAGRRDAVRVPFTVTVPQPLNKQAERAPIDMHWQIEAGQGRPLSHWHEHPAADLPRTSRHLHLVSSH